MLPFTLKYIVRGRQKLDVSDSQPRFFEDFAGRGGREGFAVFEVAAGTLEGAWIPYQ
jgi:hypothetical protein